MSATRSQPLAVLPLVALMFSAVAPPQAGVIPTARAMFAMSRDRTLGPVWSKVSPQYGTPAAGTLLIGALAMAVAALALVIPRLADMIMATVSAVGIVVALSYALTAPAAAVRLRSLLREGWRQGGRAVVLPTLSAATLLSLGGCLGWSFYTSTDHLELRADNGWFLLLTPLAMIASGFVAASWAKWVRGSPYFRTGEGSDADAPQLLATPQ
ncbi:amino acid permease [Streptomyces sp. DG2A-72]|uniref:amino acid permease n=1 Tax=Streptomyces sp. DG2A-72 TaxID=3051386 RepID=UPI00265C52E5|nr:amino acid permease [Streptomyces sp. DG2A-72]MDO0938686.1 amino acid permease [Streptomyces sp. DG2A-72]